MARRFLGLDDATGKHYAMNAETLAGYIESYISGGMAEPSDTLFVSPAFTGLGAPYYTTIASAISATTGSAKTTIIVYEGDYNERITPKAYNHLHFMSGAVIKPTSLSSSSVITISQSNVVITGALVLDMSSHGAVNCNLMDISVSTSVDMHGLLSLTSAPAQNFNVNISGGTSNIRAVNLAGFYVSGSSTAVELDVQRIHKMWLTGGDVGASIGTLKNVVTVSGGESSLYIRRWKPFSVSSYCVSMSGGVCHIEGMYFSGALNGYSFSVSAGTLRLRDCHIEQTTYDQCVFYLTGTAVVDAYGCSFIGRNETLVYHATTGIVKFFNCYFRNKRTSGTNSYIIQCITANGSIVTYNCMMIVDTGPTNRYAVYYSGFRALINLGSGANVDVHSDITVDGEALVVDTYYL